MEKKIIQQGDVVLESINEIPTGERTGDDQTSNKILAYGEATGHAHRVISGESEVFKILSKLYLNAITECRIGHEEHKQVVVPPGKYEIQIVRETDWLTRVTRRVAD